MATTAVFIPPPDLTTDDLTVLREIGEQLEGTHFFALVLNQAYAER